MRFSGALSDDDIGYADGDAKMPPLNSVFNPRWRDVTSGTAHPITVEKKGEKKNKVVPDKGIDLTTQAADAWVFSKSSMKHEVKVGKVSKKKGCASKFTNDGTTLIKRAHKYKCSAMFCWTIQLSKSRCWVPPIPVAGEQIHQQ